MTTPRTEYHLAYQRRRFANDPEYAERRRANDRQRKADRYRNDPIFRAKQMWMTKRAYYMKKHSKDIGEFAPHLHTIVTETSR